VLLYWISISLGLLQLTAVSVHEDGFELTLTASYALRHNETNRGPPIRGSRVLSDLTQRRRHIDSESDESDERESFGEFYSFIYPSR